jgi:hypothetical protein
MSQRAATFTLLISLCLVFSLPSEARRARNLNSARAALQHPLIIGASVSSGYSTVGPGSRAAFHFTARENIINVAHSGAAGRDFANLTAASLNPYTSVIAVDFLFWDSTGGDLNASLNNLQNLISGAAQVGAPLILGDIPQLLSWQVNRTILNQYVHALCISSRGCHILGLDQLHRVAVSEGIVIGGVRYYFRDLTTDGIHLNEVGSDYLAQIIIAILQAGPARR